MRASDFERVEFWASIKPPPLGASQEIEEPMLFIGIAGEGDNVPSVAFHGYTDHDGEDTGEWVLRRPLRELMQYWLDMHRIWDTNELVMDHPEARLLSKLCQAYDEWEDDEKTKDGIKS